MYRVNISEFSVLSVFLYRMFIIEENVRNLYR